MIHGQVVQLREDGLGGLVAAQVLEMEVEGDQTRVAALHQGIHGGVRDVVEADAVGDDQADDQREVEGRGHQLHPGKQLAPAEERQHAHHHREEHQPQHLSGYLVLLHIAVDDGADAHQEIEVGHGHERAVHRPVDLGEHHRVVHALKGNAPVEEVRPAHGHGRGKDGGGEQQQRRPQPAVQANLAHAEHHEHEIASADVGQPVGRQRLLQRLGAAEHGPAQVRHRHQHEGERDVHVEVLVPHEHVDQRQRQRQHEHDIVVGGYHIIPPGGFVPE